MTGPLVPIAIQRLAHDGSACLITLSHCHGSISRHSRGPGHLIIPAPRVLAGILEGDPMDGGGRVDLAAGDVWPAPAVDYAREIRQEDEDESNDADKWLWVHCEGSRDGYRDMERFIGTVRDPGRADRLEIAISGRGAFRRFKDVLARCLENWIAGSSFPRSASVAGPEAGWPTPVTTSVRDFLPAD